MTSRDDTDPQQLVQELSDAVSRGDTAAALKITQLLDKRLKKRTAVPPQTPREEATLAFAAAPSVVPLRGRPRSSGSARQSVTAALAEIGVPSRARLIADYAEARFGDPIDPKAFAALRRDERRAWMKRSPRPTFVVPALEGRFFQPIRGLLALSDWPIERRLIGPWSERADHLAATQQLARQLAWLSERDPDGAQRLAPVVASMARSVPGALEAGTVDTARVDDAAGSELRVLAERDDPWRREAAARARQQLDEEQQLWGARMGVVAEGDG